MRLLTIVLGVACVNAILCMSEMWTPRAIAGPPTGSTTSVSHPVHVNRTNAEKFAEPRLDLYGNEVDDAVSDYRVDPRGDLYERHSPDTAMLILTPAGA